MQGHGGASKRRPLVIARASRPVFTPHPACMASEKIGYNVFPVLPVTGPVTSVAFGMDTATTGANVILNGTSFSARVQVSNAIVRGGPAHLFIPPDASFDTSATMTAASPPTQISGPFRYIRIVLDSGTLDGANIEETHGNSNSGTYNVGTGSPPAFTVGNDSIVVNGVTLTGIVVIPTSSAGASTGSITINGVVLTGATVSA